MGVHYRVKRGGGYFSIKKELLEQRRAMEQAGKFIDRHGTMEARLWFISCIESEFCVDFRTLGFGEWTFFIFFYETKIMTFKWRSTPEGGEMLEIKGREEDVAGV